MAEKKNSLIPGSVTWRKAGAEAVILDLETSEYYSANDSGTFIWEQLNAGKSAGKIASALAEEYGLPADQADADVRSFLKALAKLKIVNPEAEK